MSALPAEVRNSSFGLEATAEDPVKNALTRTPPPNFLVLRASSLTPERLPAESLAEAQELLTRQVRQSQTQRVFLYQLVGVEVFVPSSEFISPDDIKQRLFTPESP